MPAANRRQALAPSHAPSVPQPVAGVAAHSLAGAAPFFTGPPAPSHAPSLPQVAAPLSVQAFLGSAPVLIGPHTPSAEPVVLLAARQLMHEPLQAVAQQTPSTQKPDRHSAPCTQAPPDDCASP